MQPGRLYKYRADSEFTSRIISDRRVWLATADTLNDPLECQTGLIPDEWKRKVIREQEEARFMGVLFDLDLRPVETLMSLDRGETKRWLKSFRKLPHPRKVRRMHELYERHGLFMSDMGKMFEKLEHQLATVGIFSLSDAEDQQLLWSHYADGHKGLALGFAVEPGCPLADPEHLIQVTYQDEKPVFSDGYRGEVRISSDPDGSVRSESRFALSDPVFRASISTKPPFWAYEREWRYVDERSGSHPLPGRLASVTFGFRMPPERRSAYSRLLIEHGFDAELREVTRTATGEWEVRRYDGR